MIDCIFTNTLSLFKTCRRINIIKYNLSVRLFYSSQTNSIELQITIWISYSHRITKKVLKTKHTMEILLNAIHIHAGSGWETISALLSRVRIPQFESKCIIYTRGNEYTHGIVKYNYHFCVYIIHMTYLLNIIHICIHLRMNM